MALHLFSRVVSSSSTSHSDGQDQHASDHHALIQAIRALHPAYKPSSVRRLSTFISPFVVPAHPGRPEEEDEVIELPSSSAASSCSSSFSLPSVSHSDPCQQRPRVSATTIAQVRQHLAKVWHLPENRIQALLVSTACLDEAQLDQEWIYIVEDQDWIAFTQCLSSRTTQVAERQEPKIKVDIVLSSVACDEAQASRAGSNTDAPYPRTPSSTTSTPGVGPRNAPSTNFDDPEEVAPGLSSAPGRADSDASQLPSASLPPLITALAAASAGMDLASGIVSSLGGLARSVSLQADQMRSTRFASSQEPQSASGTTHNQPQDSAELAAPSISVVSERQRLEEIPFVRQAAGLSPVSETIADPVSDGGEQPETFEASPSLLAGLSAELAAMRSARVASSSTYERPAASQPPRRLESRSRSRSRGRSLLSSTISLLALLLFLFAITSPVDASPSPPAVQLSSTPLIEATMAKRSPPQHLCKCTCFSTNSTLVPIFAPADPAKPCLTCTRQFCIDQGLEICKGARIAPTDGDTGTGWEGDVWAKCFERDDYKDQSIILLYLITVVGLVAVTVLRGRVRGWYEEYRSAGPRGLFNAVANAPWRTRR
ncbi:uncharacterized protein PFL1_06857 [Pseudozyma flocculosa PF-1]|uniref:Uncharacterized protein n=1 Tax=Pseudozyma flocculosa PF-1 TaxID=1277687 RepID=A0A061HBR1_9BASI|nr:uncharacterized protein PFL1_06857 [Pseudozyma flocculosa PF-1]EPQ29919.1 hypothetical protein PFL1_06857 [Pseudozyma flocculosa PF-1]